jgi:phosphoribosyl-dephospho-CoA transferase
VRPNEFFCTPYPIYLTVGEKLNAWIIKDESQNEILSIEFECTGAVKTQAHTQHVLGGGVALMLSQLKAVMAD